MENMEEMALTGRFEVVCLGPDGEEKWRDWIDNLVVTVGKNLALDTVLAGAAYTVTGPFLGLISSVGYGAGPVAGDTMSSHAGWTEAGPTNAPDYTGNRKTVAWNAAAAGSKAMTAAQAYAITGTGTVKGCFLVYGPSATNAKDSTVGVLYSAGTFTGGDKVVGSGDTLNVSYTATA